MKHKFGDTPSDICDCSNGSETLEHYLLKCTNYTNARHDLMQSINPLLIAKRLLLMHELSKVKLLIYGHDTFSLVENKAILNATIKYINDTERF